MKRYRFHQLDVFSQQPLRGNPLAVVHDADGLSDAAMADLARWTNLSETVFLQKPVNPQADYLVRIFTPRNELPFAGHPTLGSCFAWLHQGGRPADSEFIVQECGIGLVRIRRDGSRLAFAAPPLRRSGALDEATLDQIVASLGLRREDILRHQWADNGPGWAVVMLAEVERVLALKPDAVRLAEIKLGVMAPWKSGGECAYEVRAFVPSMGITEDPVTGSLNAGIARWLAAEGLAPDHYVISQGTAMQRKGRVYVDRIGADIWIGGDVAVCVEGTIEF